ncbi:hypothetical protein B0H10DRAFT_1939939 [Mycena sp. CBHHK59/15]|nr:hypothetical protein B0H10DRAFT_1939939 [Mycena sp. CBHHK59/15]
MAGGAIRSPFTHYFCHIVHMAKKPSDGSNGFCPNRVMFTVLAPLLRVADNFLPQVPANHSSEFKHMGLGIGLVMCFLTATPSNIAIEKDAIMEYVWRSIDHEQSDSWDARPRKRNHYAQVKPQWWMKVQHHWILLDVAGASMGNVEGLPSGGAGHMHSHYQNHGSLLDHVSVWEFIAHIDKVSKTARKSKHFTGNDADDAPELDDERGDDPGTAIEILEVDTLRATLAHTSQPTSLPSTILTQTEAMDGRPREGGGGGREFCAARLVLKWLARYQVTWFKNVDH